MRRKNFIRFLGLRECAFFFLFFCFPFVLLQGSHSSANDRLLALRCRKGFENLKDLRGLDAGPECLDFDGDLVDGENVKALGDFPTASTEGLKLFDT
jgi:hypothetical protein